MAKRKHKVHGVIHTAAAAAAGVGAGLAQVPGSDAPVLCSIQTAMIVAIAELHGASITKAGSPGGAELKKALEAKPLSIFPENCGACHY